MSRAPRDYYELGYYFLLILVNRKLGNICKENSLIDNYHKYKTSHYQKSGRHGSLGCGSIKVSSGIMSFIESLTYVMKQ